MKRILLIIQFFKQYLQCHVHNPEPHEQAYVLYQYSIVEVADLLRKLDLCTVQYCRIVDLHSALDLCTVQYCGIVDLHSALDLCTLQYCGMVDLHSALDLCTV